MSNLFLIFSSHFDRDKGLEEGRLSLNSLSEGTKEIWVASSSHTTGQKPEGFHRKGGYLPPQYRIPGLKNWSVDTRAIAMPAKAGVRGNFYRILPYSVTTDKGGIRGDFGIHKDADEPGSLGCIVLKSDRFKDFESKIKLINQRFISLFVQYS